MLENQSDLILKSLYSIRCREARAITTRSSQCDTCVTQLIDGFLDDNQLTCPYYLTQRQFQDLLARCPNLRDRGEGLPTRVADIYLYRLAELSSIIYNCGWHGTLNKNNDTDAFEKIKESIANYYDPRDEDREWLSLSELADGSLTGRCGFTWWTDYVIPPNDVILAKKRLGLTGSCLTSTVPRMLMRLDVSKVSQMNIIRVPTLIDGYLSLIFRYWLCSGQPRPRNGRTIDLTDLSELTDGAAEYAVKPIPVDAVMIRPIVGEHNRSNLAEVEEDVRLYVALESFYNAMAEP